MRKLELESGETLNARKKICKNIINNATRIGNYMIASIPPELLAVEDYQRIPRSTVRKLAEEWDDSKCSELLVSYNDFGGYFSVIDGQHRTLAAKMTGRPDIKLTCIIYEGLTMSQEAVLFALQNENVKPLTSYDIYNANLRISDDDATNAVTIDKIIAKVCNKYDIRVERGRGKKMLNCLSSCRKIVGEVGSGVLDDFFGLYDDTGWDLLEGSYATVYFDALLKVYRLHVQDWKIARGKLERIMKANTPVVTKARARTKYPDMSDRACITKYLSDVAA